MRNLFTWRFISAFVCSWLAVTQNGQCAEEHATSKAAAPIKIGVITSVTGIAAGASKETLNGFDLFLDQVKHRIAGRPVEVIVEDDQSNREQAISKAHKLIEENKVDILMGVILANISYGVAPIANKYEVPFLLQNSGADDLTQRKRLPWIVRTGSAASQALHPFGEYAAKTLGYKRVVTIGMDYPLGWDVIGGFHQSFEEAGGKVVQKIWVPMGTTDFAPFIKQITNDADAVFELTVLDAAEAFPKQFAQAGLKMPLLGGGTSFDEIALRRMSDAAVGAISAWNYSPTINTPANRKFVAAYEKRYQGVTPSYYAEAGYTAGLWIQKALESLEGQTENKANLLAALKRVELKDAPRGPLKLDEHANATQNIYVRRVDKVKGKLQNTVTHTFPNVSQFGKTPPAKYLEQPVYGRDFPPCKNCQSTK